FAKPIELPKDDEPPEDVPRDRWGRPVIVPPNGGEPIAYLRASTLAGCLDDKTNLGDWKARMTGRGVAISPDLQAGFAAIPDMDSREGKATARELADQAQERATASRKRVVGTAFHSLSEVYDKTGQRPEHVPPALLPLLEDYIAKTANVRWLGVEMFVVNDELTSAGAFDRVGQRPSELPRIWDIKTGRVDFGALKFAIQFAVYAHGKFYNAKTQKRVPFPSIDLSIAHVIHADPDTGVVTIYDIDIEKGWEAAKIARRVHELRADKTIMTLDSYVPGIDQGQEAVDGQVVDLDEVRKKTERSMMAKAMENSDPSPRSEGRSIMQRLAACTTIDELTDLWNETGKEWLPKHRKFSTYMAEDIRKRQEQASE